MVAPSLPLPKVEAAGAPAALAGTAPFLLRRFGADAAALAVDLSGQALPETITAILTACAADRHGRPVDPERIWRLSVGTRIAYLLVLAAQEAGRPFTLILSCPAAACTQPMEVELTLDEILAVAAMDAPEVFLVEVAGSRYLLRRPTGADQRIWRRADFTDRGQAARAMLRDLVVEGPLEHGNAHRAALEAALDAHDPLLRFTMTAVCPFCGAAGDHEVDLTAVALDILRRVQSRLLEEVHLLARAYGWAEAAVLVVAPWRRARYLDLVERERGR